ncbi:MAG: penicillin-binding protein 1C [Chitinophagales bacterium]|nr:penicillin-binding protein 1C [Bacteroidota bacterium]MBP9219875.1 penicillin-binding protein 1C [Chitinophagales bacterium]MBP9794458.1 penicillin-binding protein 1C [Chitinophagales bacterium]
MSGKSKIHTSILNVHNAFEKSRYLRILKKAAKGFLFFLIFYFALNLFFPLHVKIEYSQIVTADDGSVLHAFLTSDDKWRMLTELEEITPDMQSAIVFKEDKYFYRHPGVNPASIVRALYNNITSGNRTSGASTITMQVARLLDPKQRTYGNKFIEMFRALQLDMLYSKQEILQMYLNLVPYGGNIEGVKAASVLYLEKTPSVLSLAELTALSIIPNRPTSLRPGVNNDVIIKERNKWLERFRDANLFPEDIINDAIVEPFTAFRTQGPEVARHFCTRMKFQYPGDAIVKTTLNTEIQLKSEKILSDYIKQLWGFDIHNGAAIVIDNRTHQITAYVGSADFFNTADGGQVDGVQAIRSPGSTLKPLVYAMAFDAGITTPHSIIADVPVNYSGYSPENYDEDYHGNVSVEFALSHSLNIPAVKTLNQVGLDKFINTLIEGNFKSIEKKRNDLGLSVALGGCGVTLEQLTRLYASFANEGKYQHIKWLQSDMDTSSVSLITPEAAFMTTEILTQLTRPDLPNYYQNAKNVPLIAWKTGTSYGRKDAWSIGYNNNYTIGVWVGNFSGKGVPELTGANIATPLLFNLFNAIESDNNKDWNKMPEHVDFRYVCSETGKNPNDFCANVVIDYFIPGVSKNEMCDHLLRVKIAEDESFSYCTTCLPESGYMEKYYQHLSPEIITWMQTKNIPVELIPPHNPDCERIFAEGAPTINSPVNNLEYYIDKTDIQKIMLSANVASDVKKVFWYINDKLLTQADSKSPVFYEPEEGKIKISCSDDKGRNTNIEIDVVFF